MSPAPLRTAGHDLGRVSTTEVLGTMSSRLMLPPHPRWSRAAEWSG